MDTRPPRAAPRPAAAPTATVPTLAFSLIALLAAQGARADAASLLDGIKRFHPYGEIGYTYDSNLLRKSDSAARLLPNGLGNGSDNLLTLAAGFDTELKASRQRFLFDGRVFHNLYDRYSQLDYTGGRFGALWKWVYGDLWDGEIGYSFDRQQRAFENMEIPAKDLRDRQRVFAGANRWLATRWRAGVSVDWTDISFSESHFLDKTVLGAGARLDYITQAGNKLGIAATYAVANYKNVDDLDYQDFAIGPVAEWSFSTKLRLVASAGYKTRRYDDRIERDYEGFVGRLKAIWRPTVKTSLAATVWRDIGNLDDEIANYAIIDGVKIEPVWNITTKTSLTAFASFERRDFQGTSREDALLGLAERVDEVTTYGARLEWRPRPTIVLALGIEAGSRNSNRELKDYDFQTVMASVRIGL
jgi:hypothetical protein